VSALVVIPTHQEAQNIGAVLSMLQETASEIDVLVIDDASTDGTGSIARSFDSPSFRVNVIERPTKNGLGNAYRLGFQYALDHGYDVVAEMDADLSHDPRVLPELVAIASLGIDLAIGSRYVPGGRIEGWPKGRLRLSRWGNRYVALMLGLAINDATAGFRAFTTETVRKNALTSTKSDGYTFQIETTYRLVRNNARIVEVPIVFRERVAGTSKMSKAIVREALLNVTRWGIKDILRGKRKPVYSTDTRDI
jgi:dolichol-phosphate mannosyltransferase